MRRTRPGWTLVLASFGAFLTALDVVVVATALPAIRSELHASLAELEWTINAYALAFACLMLTGAAVGDRLGRRRMYVVGVAVFTAGSVLAALSTTADVLITARVVQGVGAALLMPLSLTLVVDAFPAARRAGAIGIWAGITGLGVAAGPVVGGVIVQTLAWQAIFWLNVPIGLALAVLSARYLRESHGGRRRFDLVGVVLAAAGLFGLSWAPVRAPALGWTNDQVLGSLALGIVLIGTFVAWERRTPHPMLPLAYFRLRGFAVGNVLSFVQYLSVLGSLFMISQFLQVGLGHGPMAAGLRILPWTCTPMLVAPLAGALAGRYGSRPLMITGMALQAAGLAWLTASVETGSGYGGLVVPLVVAGVGLSLGLPAVATAVTGAVPPQAAGVASGTSRTVAQAGGLFGVAIVAVVFASHGGYESPSAFVDGFVPAMWVAALVPIAGLVAALFAPRRAVAPAPAAESAVEPAVERELSKAG
jgi:EmrB/QacA subfamily drug resistance transporter